MCTIFGVMIFQDFAAPDPTSNDEFDLQPASKLQSNSRTPEERKILKLNSGKEQTLICSSTFWK